MKIRIDNIWRFNNGNNIKLTVFDIDIYYAGGNYGTFIYITVLNFELQIFIPEKND